MLHELAPTMSEHQLAPETTKFADACRFTSFSNRCCGVKMSGWLIAKNRELCGQHEARRISACRFRRRDQAGTKACSFRRLHSDKAALPISIVQPDRVLSRACLRGDVQ